MKKLLLLLPLDMNTCVLPKCFGYQYLLAAVPPIDLIACVMKKLSTSCCQKQHRLPL